MAVRPCSGLALAEGGDYYGTTYGGGVNNLGTVFKVTPDGKFTSVVSFNGTDGSHPDSKLIEWSNGYFYMIHLWNHMLYKNATAQWSGDNFCGTTSSGGSYGNGTVFKIGDDGSIVTLVSFTGSEGLNLGATPDSLIAGEDGNLYGTTGFGGTDSQGTIFRLQLQIWPPPHAGEERGSASMEFKPPIVSR